MTNLDKYRDILKNLDFGYTQSEITLFNKCSYSTISKAKAWRLDGYPVKNGKMKSSSSEISSENIPNDIIEILEKGFEIDNLAFVSQEPIINYIWLRNLAQQMRIKGCHQISKKQLKIAVKKLIDLI